MEDGEPPKRKSYREKRKEERDKDENKEAVDGLLENLSAIVEKVQEDE